MTWRHERFPFLGDFFLLPHSLSLHFRLFPLKWRSCAVYSFPSRCFCFEFFFSKLQTFASTSFPSPVSLSLVAPRVARFFFLRLVAPLGFAPILIFMPPFSPQEEYCLRGFFRHPGFSCLMSRYLPFSDWVCSIQSPFRILPLLLFFPLGHPPPFPILGFPTPFHVEAPDPLLSHFSRGSDLSPSPFPSSPDSGSRV